MLSSQSISSTPISSYLDSLLSGESYEIVMHMSSGYDMVVYIISEINIETSIKGFSEVIYI